MSEPKRWDLFISHATEDKEAIARPLREGLERLDVRVWFDESELRVGDSLQRKIDEGLARSTFGAVILSKHFFSKRWPAYELAGLTARTVEGDSVILPIWHGVTKQDVLHFSPPLADLVGLNSSEGTDKVIAKLIDRIRPGIEKAPVGEPHRRRELSGDNPVVFGTARIQTLVELHRSMQRAIGLLVAVANPLRYTPDFLRGPDEDEELTRILNESGLTPAETRTIMQSRARASEFTRVHDSKLLARATKELSEFHNALIEERILIDPALWRQFHSIDAAMQSAAGTLRMCVAESEWHKRYEVYKALSSLTDGPIELLIATLQEIIGSAGHTRDRP